MGKPCPSSLGWVRGVVGSVGDAGVDGRTGGVAGTIVTLRGGAGVSDEKSGNEGKSGCEKKPLGGGGAVF